MSSTSPTNIFWLLHFWSWGKPQTSKDLETDTAIIKARKCTTTTAVILLLKLFKDYLLSSMYFFRQSKVEQITLVMISTEHLHSTERQMTPQQIFSCENQNRTSVSKALQIRRVRHSPHSWNILVISTWKQLITARSLLLLYKKKPWFTFFLVWQQSNDGYSSCW